MVVADIRAGKAKRSSWSARVNNMKNWLYCTANSFDSSSSNDPKHYKLYQLRKSNYIYFFGGKLRTSRSLIPLFNNTVKVHSVPIMLAIMIFYLIMFLVFEASWYWHNISPAIVIIFCYVWIVMISSFFKASLFDPGMLPMNIHLIDDFDNLPLNYTIDHNESFVAIPGGYQNNHLIPMKYCNSCFIWRPARSTHCSKCGVCVLNMDHHCPWLGTCIAQRNYWNFINFLLFSSFILVYSIAIFLVKIVHFGGVSKSHWCALFLTIFSFILLPYLILLLLFHTYAGFVNVTTREFLNMDNPTNNKFKDVLKLPFYSPNLFSNFRNQWLRSRGWPNARARANIDSNDIRVKEIVIGEV